MGKDAKEDRSEKEAEFDRFVEDLQQAIIQEEERLYSEKVRTEASMPSNMGFIENADATAQVRGSCGDTMVFDIKVEEGRITDMRFRTDGCGATLACGSMLSKMAIGMTVEEARAFTNLDLEKELGGLPEENKHCAVLSVSALQKVLDNYEGLETIE